MNGALLLSSIEGSRGSGGIGLVGEFCWSLIEGFIGNGMYILVRTPKQLQTFSGEIIIHYTIAF